MFVTQGPPADGVFYVRTTSDPEAIFGTLRNAVREMDESLPVSSMRTLEEQVDRSVVSERMIARLSGAFGSIATLVALVGLYGVMAFTVARRAKEISIRVTLGDQFTKVRGLMMREVVFVI